MASKTVMIIGVAVVAIVVIAAAAFVMTQGDKDYTAKELAEKFVKNYDGDFGEFTVELGASDDVAILTQKVEQQNWKGEELGATRGVNIKIVHCESKDAAAAEFDKYLTVKDAPYSTKNGTKGETLVTQVNKLGMADQHPTVLDDAKNISPLGEGATIKDVKAKDFGGDQIYLLYAAYFKTDDDTKQQYSQFSGVLLDGKNLIIINQSSKDEFSMYHNVAIMDSDECPEGGVYITVEDFEKEVKKFFKAF